MDNVSFSNYLKKGGKVPSINLTDPNTSQKNGSPKKSTTSYDKVIQNSSARGPIKSYKQAQQSPSSKKG
jgi:hypothetical protein